MKKIMVGSILCLFIFVFISCENIFNGMSSNKEINAASKKNAIQITENLNVLAPIFSSVINSHPSLHTMIFEEACRQFDGDYDVLFETLKDREFPQPEMRKRGKLTFLDLLENAYKTHIVARENNPSPLATLIHTIPHFNLYYYHPDEGGVLQDNHVIVTSLRYDKDDNEIITLPGYDEHGNVIDLYADQRPDFPVIVLGINERIYNMPNNNGGGRHLLESGNEIHHIKSRMEDNSEPWFWGSPEIWMLFADSCDADGDTSRIVVSKNLTDFNKEDTWWQKDIYCLRWSSVSGDRFGVFYMEDDADAWFHDLKEITLELSAEVAPKIGGGIKFSYEKAVSNGVFGGKKWYDEDDYLGDALVYGADDGNITADGHRYSTGNVDFYLKTLAY
jgi:hypothetical protein